MSTCRSGTKGCSRNYPRGAAFFFRPLHPQDTHGVSAPRPPGHVSALINPPHYELNMPWPPGQVTPPHPSDTSTKHPPPTGPKSACAPPPREFLEHQNFWWGVVAQWYRARLTRERSRARSPAVLNMLRRCAPRQGTCSHLHSLDPGVSGYLVGQWRLVCLNSSVRQKWQPGCVLPGELRWLMNEQVLWPGGNCVKSGE